MKDPAKLEEIRSKNPEVGPKIDELKKILAGNDYSNVINYLKNPRD